MLMEALDEGETMNFLPPQGLSPGQRAVGSEDQFVISDDFFIRMLRQQGRLIAKEKDELSLT